MSGSALESATSVLLLVAQFAAKDTPAITNKDAIAIIIAISIFLYFDVTFIISAPLTSI